MIAKGMHRFCYPPGTVSGHDYFARILRFEVPAGVLRGFRRPVRGQNYQLFYRAECSIKFISFQAKTRLEEELCLKKLGEVKLPKSWFSLSSKTPDRW